MVDITWNMPPRTYSRASFSSPDRMAGTVAVWGKTAGDAAGNITNTMAQSLVSGDQQKNNTIAPSLSFDELLDVINPLQHIPIIGGFYRKMTGDMQSPVAEIAGGALYGGALGGIVSLVNAMVEEHAGKPFGAAVMDNAFADHQPDDGSSNAPIQISSNGYHVND